jgi:hypothetical protein
MRSRGLTLGLVVTFTIGGACLCGREIDGWSDGGPDGGDSGATFDVGPDAGDAGPNSWDDAGSDAGIDCSATCDYDDNIYCANQVVVGACLICRPDLDGGFLPQQVGAPCDLTFKSPLEYPPYNRLGACFISSDDEVCECGVNGSTCWAPTACCWGGLCQDAGAYAFCLGNRGPCGHPGQCLSGICCTADGGSGECADERGECP